MNDNDKLESGESSWDRHYNTVTVNQDGNVSGGNDGSGPGRTTVMEDDQDDDRHSRDGHGSSD